jgi:hypothetical protein
VTRIGDRLDGGRQLVGQLRRKLDELAEDLLDRMAQGLELGSRRDRLAT